MAAAGPMPVLSTVISPGVIEARVVDAADLQHGGKVAGFGQEAILVPEPIQVELYGE
jgi:hypothetical protein